MVADERSHALIFKELAGQLGQLYYYDSVRVNLGLFQHDVNVIWDLAVHDISIMDYVLPLRPVAVSACGVKIPNSVGSATSRSGEAAHTASSTSLRLML